MTTKATAKDTFYATRDFTDAGTERSFEAGREITEIDEGTARNYAAAGLASTEKPAAEKSVDKPSTDKATA